MMTRLPALLPIAAAALLAACSATPDEGPLVVGVVAGAEPQVIDPSQKPVTPESAVLLAATAQGLVRFDAGGQIEPGLAIRWDVSDDGLYYTFRIADSDAIDAEQAALWLRAAIGPTSRNPLKPVLGAVSEIVAVTPEVIEIHLTGPRPDLLSILAQPEMAILARGVGTGPFAIARRSHASLLLTPTDPATNDAEPAQRERMQVRLLPERAARAVARFAAGRSGIVLGGRFADLAVARAAGMPAALLHYDPTAGLFGLVATRRDGFAAVADNRRALAMAIDRSRIAAMFGAGWRSVSTIVPAPLADRPVPATPDWIDTDIAQRRGLARETIASWMAAQGDAPTVRLAMPEGPGGRMLFALIADDWARIGVTAVRAGKDEEADLTLIDLVAPGESASWYLRQFECVRAIACSEQADIALAAARAASTLPARAAYLAEADNRLAEISAFIPIAAPLRWSLVARRLGAFQENKRAAHPLDQLRDQ